MKLFLIFLTIFFNPIIALGKDRLVYSYGKDKLYEISKGRFVIIDGAGNRNNIVFGGKSPYSFSDLDKEAVQSGMLNYGKLVASCGGHYYKYDGNDEKNPPYNDLNIVEGTNMAWVIEISELSEADRLNGIEWRGQIVIGLMNSIRRYYIRNSAWTDWRSDHYVDDYMGHSQKVRGQWEYALSQRDGQNRSITCSDIPQE